MKKLKKLIFFSIFSAVFVLAGNGVLAMTDKEISDLISELQTEILNYQQKIADLSTKIIGLQKEISEGEEKETFCHTFNANIDFGEAGDEVSALQSALSKSGFSSGDEELNDSFGKKTENAVINFQEKYKSNILGPWGFKSGTGYVGTTTREKLNELYACKEEVLEEVEEEDISATTTEEVELIEEVEEITEEESATGTEAEAGACFDSDSGKDYYVKGYTTIDGGTTKDWDSCRYFYTAERSVDVLYETYCEDGKAQTDEHQCLLGCMSSACVEHMQSDLTFSSVSFSPEELLTTETIEFSGILENLGNIEAAKVSIGCLIKEGDAVFYEGTTTLEDVLPSEGEISFSFKVPKAFAKQGNYLATLKVDPGNTINESDETNNQTTKEFFVTEKPICFDSDGKKDIYSKGYLTMDKGTTTSWDVCVYDKVDRQYSVLEGHCENNIPKTENFPCSYGCLDGVCIKKKLVAYFTFDEEVNKIIDSSGNNLSGTISGVKSVDGKKGKALQFEGQSYVKIGDSSLLDFNAEGTILAWVKYDSSGVGGVVLSKCKNTNSFGGCNYALKLDNLTFNSASFWVGDGKSGSADNASLSSGAMVKETWYYITGVFDKSSLKIYINGELKRSSSKSMSNPPGINDFDLLIGSMNCASLSDCNHFKGLIDEVKIYNYALSATEIKADYDQY